MDTQVVELVGRHRLMDDLLHAGLEVAVPARDRGIDLIAYADLTRQVGRFAARPIQMKASAASGFGIDQKYDKIADLILAYVWHLDTPGAAVTYALTYAEAVGVAEAMRWVQTASWEAGSYVSTKPSRRLLKLLEPFRMTPAKWWAKVTAGAAGGPGQTP